MKCLPLNKYISSVARKPGDERRINKDFEDIEASRCLHKGKPLSVYQHALDLNPTFNAELGLYTVLSFLESKRLWQGPDRIRQLHSCHVTSFHDISCHFQRSCKHLLALPPASDQPRG